MVYQKVCFKNLKRRGASLAVQWIRLQAPTAGGVGLIPGWGLRCHMWQGKKKTVKRMR